MIAQAIIKVSRISENLADGAQLEIVYRLLRVTLGHGQDGASTYGKNLHLCYPYLSLKFLSDTVGFSYTIVLLF